MTNCEIERERTYNVLYHKFTPSVILEDKLEFKSGSLNTQETRIGPAPKQFLHLHYCRKKGEFNYTPEKVKAISIKVQCGRLIGRLCPLIIHERAYRGLSSEHS